MATITWGGSSGLWSSPTSWGSLKLPGTADTAKFLATDTSTVTIAAPASVRSVSVAAGSGVSLLVQSTLSLTGTLTLAGGTLALPAGGTISGGTVNLAGGAVQAGGGVIDGSVVLGTLGEGLTVTAATIAATEKALKNAPLAVVGTLALTGDTTAFDNTVLSLHTFGSTAGSELDVANGGLIVLGTNVRLSLSQDDPSHTVDSNPSGPAPVIGGLGTIETEGTLVSDALSATIAAAGFVNAGQMSLVNAVVLDESAVFAGGTELTWTATFAPSLTLTSATFENDGTLSGAGATVNVLGASFVNTGLIDLGSATAQGPVAGTAGGSGKSPTTTEVIGTIQLASTLQIGAAVATFSNSGVISANQIDFAGSVDLTSLGTLRGTVIFTGTLNLDGGTLDATSLAGGTSYIIRGTVENGTIFDTNGSVDTSGATLVDTALLFSQPTTLTNVAGPGTVVLGTTTTDIAYTAASTIDSLTVVAGAPGITNGLIMRGGRLTFGSKTSIRDTLAGSHVTIDGGDFIEHGNITLAGSKLEIATLDGSGTITLSANAVLTIDSLASTAGITVKFGGGASALILPGDSSGLGRLGLTVSGLAAGDLLDFTGVSDDPGTVFAQAGAAISSGTLMVQGASGDQARVNTTASDLTFSAAQDSNGGTLISVACFRHGTRIATPQGERPVEALAVGDEVLTLAGDARRIRWLGRRAYARALVARQPQLRPVRLAAGALGGGLPRRPLWLSPLHGLLIDGLLVPVGGLVNGRSITRAAIADVAYVHIELDTPDILLAEGAPSESFVDCNNRDMFQNCLEYPGPPPPSWAFPVPRVEEGWELEAIRARLAAQAGASLAPPAPGRLRGHIDEITPSRVEGWVMDEAAPSAPVAVELLAGRTRLGYLVANRYRIDLDVAGIGWAMHGFTASLPTLPPAALTSLALVRLTDGARLTV